MTTRLVQRLNEFRDRFDVRERPLALYRIAKSDHRDIEVQDTVNASVEIAAQVSRWAFFHDSPAGTVSMACGMNSIYLSHPCPYKSGQEKVCHMLSLALEYHKSIQPDTVRARMEEIFSHGMNRYRYHTGHRPTEWFEYVLAARLNMCPNVEYVERQMHSDNLNMAGEVRARIAGCDFRAATVVPHNGVEVNFYICLSILKAYDEYVRQSAN